MIIDRSKSTNEMILVIGYCLLQILSNLTVAKTVTIFYFTIPIGSILYAVSFTWMDISNHYLGINKIKVLIKIMVVVNLLVALWLRIYIFLPTNEWSENSFESKAISYVFGNYFRITIASIIAGYVSGNINATVFNYMKIKAKMPIYIWSIVSNLLSSLSDGVLFYIVAFSFIKPWKIVIVSAVSSALYKGCISLLTVPVLLLLKEKGMFNAL